MNLRLNRTVLLAVAALVAFAVVASGCGSDGSSTDRHGAIDDFVDEAPTNVEELAEARALAEEARQLSEEAAVNAEQAQGHHADARQIADDLWEAASVARAKEEATWAEDEVAWAAYEIVQDNLNAAISERTLAEFLAF